MKSKECRKCGKSKDISDFYKHKKMADGYLNHCKTCIKIRIARHRRVNLEKLRAYDRERAKLPHRKALSIKKTRKYRQQNPLRALAYGKVGRAIKRKVIERARACECCGDDKRKLEGHHEDYSRPLDVVWVCKPCHYKLDQERKLKESA